MFRTKLCTRNQERYAKQANSKEKGRRVHRGIQKF